MKPILSLAQMTIQLGKPDLNFEIAASLVDEAARRGSQLILLPELWSTGYDLRNGPLHSRANLGVLDKLQSLARSREIIIGGSLLLAGESGKIFNTFVITPPAGNPTRYNKVHLFRLMDEEKWLEPGGELRAMDTPWGRCGLGICYDLRFPEMFRRYALEGVQLALLPAEWPLRRIDHWKVLLRARAIENQMFVAAVNTVGEIGAETFGGASAMISPWGETLAEGDSTHEALLTAEIDLGQVGRVREHIPIFADRRPDLY